MLLPYLVLNLGATGTTARTAAIDVSISFSDSSFGTESIQVQHDLSGLFPTGSGQRHFKLSKVAAAVQQVAQPVAPDIRTFKAPALSVALPQVSGAADTAQARDIANVTIEADWQDKAVAVDSLALAIEAALEDAASGEGAATVSADADIGDSAGGLSFMTIEKRLADHVLQTQALYVMGFYG